MGDIWPKFFYHADCLEGRKFESAEAVPAGWVTGPHLVHKQPLVNQTPLPSYPEDDEDQGDDPVADQMTADAAPVKRPPGRPRRVRG